MNYHDKYLKYKTKYFLRSNNNELTNELTNGLTNELTNELTNMVGGVNNKYSCNPNKLQYKQICWENKKGKYKTKEECEKKCDSKFITIQLKKAHLHKESLQFYFFIQDLIHKEKMNIYIKGGNVIGLAVLKIIYSHYKSNDTKFKNVFEKFLKMELIKDWDFAAYPNNKINDESKFREKLDKLADKQKLVPRAKTFILYQAKYPILIYDKALFEIAILTTDSNSHEFSKMEIPLTTMKIQVNLSNIKYVFMLGKSFYSWNQRNIPIDLDIVKKILDSIEIIVHPHKSGLYDPENKIDAGELNKELIKFILDFNKGDLFWTQFFITQIEDPYRLIYRMGEKNIKKTENIVDFLKKNLPEITKIPDWLLNVDKTKSQIEKFINGLGRKLAQIYKQTNNLDKVLEFLSGANFGKPQIQIEWKEFDLESKLRLKNIFDPLVKQIGKDNFINLIKTYQFDSNIKSSSLTPSDKIIKLFSFLIENNVF